MFCYYCCSCCNVTVLYFYVCKILLLLKQVQEHITSNRRYEEWSADILYSVVGYGIAFRDFEYNPITYYDMKKDDKDKISNARSKNCLCRYTKLRDVIHELYHIPKQRIRM